MTARKVDTPYMAGRFAERPVRDAVTDRKAALFVCGRAVDAADARLLLDALGLTEAQR